MARQHATKWIKLLTFSTFALLPLRAEIMAKYTDSRQCLPCHETITKDWMSSLHAQSHFSKNPLYAAMLKYTAKNKHQSVARVEIRCAQCHNPHVGDAVTQDDMIAADYGFGTKAIQKKMEARFIKDGVNCIVCHNIKKIHPSIKASKRGKDAVEWGPNDTMVGPFKDAKSPYHKVAYADFFRKDPNKLCFVCHYNERSMNGTKIGSTGEEYESSGVKSSCVECHMGPPHMTRAVQRDLPDSTADRIRPMRRHLFAGVRNSDIVSDALDMDYKRIGHKLEITLKNLTPHKLPTGFGGRLLRVRVLYLDDHDQKVGEDHYDMGMDFVDPKGKRTIAYLASKVVKDNRIPPLSTRKISFKMPKKAKRAIVYLDYFLVDPEWAKRLKLHDPAFTKSYQIASMKVD